LIRQCIEDCATNNNFKRGEKKEDFNEEDILKTLNQCGSYVQNGARSFLKQEYTYLMIWSFLFAVVLGTTVDYLEMHNAMAPTDFPYTATSYLVGSITSILAGYIGMEIAVYTNIRVTFQCAYGATKDHEIQRSDGGKAANVYDGFLCAFRGGMVLGFVLVGLALLNLLIIVLIYRSAFWMPQAQILWENSGTNKYTYHYGNNNNDGSISPKTLNGTSSDITETISNEYNEYVSTLTRRLFELVAGYGLGGSSVALFGRVGGGIYTKAADVGADLVGKNLHDLKEDDINNPGTIADNVGDNVGDIAGMGSDLFGSLAESTCAALVVSATSYELIQHTDALFFPLAVTASGVIGSFISVWFIHLETTEVRTVQRILITQIGLSTLFMTFTVIPAMFLIPESFTFFGGAQKTSLTTSRW